MMGSGVRVPPSALVVCRAFVLRRWRAPCPKVRDGYLRSQWSGEEWGANFRANPSVGTKAHFAPRGEPDVLAPRRGRRRQGGRNRSKVLGRRRDAEAFDAEVTRRKRTGDLARLDAGKESLAEFGEEWWRLYAVPNLAPQTLVGYASMWDAHVLPRL